VDRRGDGVSVKVDRVSVRLDFICCSGQFSTLMMENEWGMGGSLGQRQCEGGVGICLCKSAPKGLGK
jgi:hypothetical protein